MFFNHRTALAGLAALDILGVARAANITALPGSVALGDGVVGALHRPEKSSPRASIAVLVMHAEEDYLTFSACTELSKRGFTVLCANNYASKEGEMTDLDFDYMMTDVGKGVSWLRNQTEFEHIVLFGHSGGGAMMTAYQNIAENGVQACQGSEKIAPCSDDLAGLDPADGLLLVDCNYGLSTMMLFSLNPAITNETSGLDNTPALDLYNPVNGFVANANSNYTADFKKAFQKGVAARNNRLVKYALERKAAIAAGDGSYLDDEPMVIPDAMYEGFNNKFFAQDTRWLGHTKYSWPLVHKNGSSTTQIVPSVRVPQNFENFGTNFTMGAIKTTVNRFLHVFGIWVDEEEFAYQEDGFTGVHLNSSLTAPAAAIQGVSVPILTIGNTGHWEYLNAEKLHLNAVSSTDVSTAFIEGATHLLTTCTECERYPGEFGNTLETAYNYMALWLGKEGRFI